MKRLEKDLITGGLLAVVVLLLTGLLAYRHPPLVGDYCFLLHLIPLGIAYSDGIGIKVLRYYLVVWLILTLLFTLLTSVMRELVKGGNQP